MIEQVAKRYTIIEKIGQGGMADVYRALDMILNREVAIKILRSKLSDDPMILVRFQREASAASRLSHPNVVDIYDVGEYDGYHYIVMEYIKGPTLKQLIARRGALDVDEAVFIMKQLTSAIEHAHQHHIIHRDIKPQNIMVKSDGTVKITDFGIAIAADAVQLTYNNAVMGSAHYLAPESAQGKDPDNRVDLYSLGIVFYELLTGKVPFTGKNPMEIAVKHLQQKMPYVRDFNPQIPQSVENIILKATCKDPNQRYQSALAMYNDLQKCLLPQYANVERIQFKEKQPVVKIDQGRITVEGYKEPEKKKKSRRRWIPYALVTLGVMAGFTLIMLVGTLAGFFNIPSIFGLQSMPSVSDMTRDEAEKTLEDAGFDLSKISYSEAVSDSVETGEVISSNIPAGRIVSKNSDIILTVSKGPSYLVPDFTGRYLSDVEEELQKDGVKLNFKIEYKGEGDTNPGIILSQSGLVAGDRIDPDANKTIHFIVTSYPSIIIPEDLIGMDVNEAKDMLNDMGVAATIKPYNYVGNDTVVMTSPSVGTEYTQQGTDSVVVLYYN